MVAFYLGTATSPKLYRNLSFPEQGGESSEGALCLEHLV